jgi:head-tail adaptor
MDLGRLDRRIRIEQPTTTTDATYGPQPGEWFTFATLWANVQEVLPSRGEQTGQGIAIATRPARVRVRWVDGLTSDMRVIYIDRDERVMKIVTPPVEIGRRQGLEFMVADFSTAGDVA